MSTNHVSPSSQALTSPTSSYHFVCLSNSRGEVRYADIVLAANEREAIYWMFYNFISLRAVKKTPTPLDQTDLLRIEDDARHAAYGLCRYFHGVTVTPWSVASGPMISFEPKRSP